MAQLFLWTQKIDETTREEFAQRFGFPVPEPLMDLHENLPEEFLTYLRFHPLHSIISEELRPPSLMPGLIPFAEDGEGDLYCLYAPWKDEHDQVPAGIWMSETNHFLPVAGRMKTFLAWWSIKFTLDSMGGPDWDENRRILELVRSSAGLEEYDPVAAPPSSIYEWHEELLKLDGRSAFSQIFNAVRQLGAGGIEAAVKMLVEAETMLPAFGAPKLWLARLHAMRGRLRAAHDAYFRHLRTPMFANGYHYWWEAGDLQIPEISESEAFQYFRGAEVKAPREIAADPKVLFFSDHNPLDYTERLRLARLLEKLGDYAGALREFENAFFLQSWDDSACEELLETLLCVYPEHNRLHEAEQCRRALSRLRHPAAHKSR